MIDGTYTITGLCGLLNIILIKHLNVCMFLVCMSLKAS